MWWVAFVGFLGVGCLGGSGFRAGPMGRGC